MPILFLITVIDLVGFGMIFPLFPMFKMKFDLSNIEIGYIASLFAIFGIFGSIFWGYLSDKFGRRLPLALPLLVVAVVYHLTGRTESVVMFIILRCLAGFFASNFSVAFAATADMSTPANRFKNMGTISASFGLGFVLGPTIGGWLAGNALELENVNFTLPFDVAGALNVLAALVTLFFFKETLTAEDRKSRRRLNIIFQMRKTFRSKNVQFFTLIMILFTSIISGVQVFLGVWLNESFNFTSQHIGLFWGVSGLIMMVVQLNISKLFTARKAMIWGFFIYGAAVSMFLIADYIHNVVLVVVAFAVMTVGAAMLMPSINARLSLEGKKNQQGLLLGVSQAMGSLGRVIGPNLFGILFFISHSVAWASTSIAAILLALLIMKVVKKEV
ncbi:MAG: MFS transporter [Alphaproteobacteria bacterium]|jgi:MFS family permease|nr:MFS transporter [Alphaproteobacteria bacterium]